VHSLNRVPEESHASKYVMINPFSYVRERKENIYICGDVLIMFLKEVILPNRRRDLFQGRVNWGLRAFHVIKVTYSLEVEMIMSTPFSTSWFTTAQPVSTEYHFKKCGVKIATRVTGGTNK